MKTKGKRLILSSHHFPFKDSEVIWADVWIRTTSKPGRKKLYLAPTLVSRMDLEEDERMNVKMKWKPDPDHKAAKEAFSQGATHFIGGGPKDMNNVYAPEASITKATAERLCLAYAQSLGIQAKRVKWTRSRVFTTPA